MEKTLLISSADKQVRAALLEGQELIEFFIDQETTPSLVGNIYRGTIEDIVPGLEAAFVQIGLERKAFLHFADIIPGALEVGKRAKPISAQYQKLLKEAQANGTSKPRKGGHRGGKGRSPRSNSGEVDWPSIIKSGQPAMVQVMKDGFGDKAPRITSNISLPGRMLVLLPFPSQSGGISKKIQSAQERGRLKRVLKNLGTKNYSFIIRTAGLTASDEELETDALELKRRWQNILRRYRGSKKEKLLHDDQNIYTRLTRDVLSPNVTKIIVDSPDVASNLKSALEFSYPEIAKVISIHDGLEDIFDKFGVNKSIKRATSPKVWMKKGGQIVIDETEALTTIDVNSGRFISKDNQDKTILETNLEACHAVAQQIRLRDLSGIIIVDFIDMQSEGSRKKVENELRRFLRRDRAKMAIGGFSDFGLFLLTRKRRRQSLLQQMTRPCPYCDGGGRVLGEIEVWRGIKRAVATVAGESKRKRTMLGVLIMVHPSMEEYVKDRFEDVVARWRKVYKIGHVELASVPEYHVEEYHVQAIEKKQQRPALRIKSRPAKDAVTAPPAEQVIADTVISTDKPVADQIKKTEEADKETSGAKTVSANRDNKNINKPAAQEKKSKPDDTEAVTSDKAGNIKEETKLEARRSSRRRGSRGRRGKGKQGRPEGQPQESKAETAEIKKETPREAPPEKTEGLDKPVAPTAVRKKSGRRPSRKKKSTVKIEVDKTAGEPKEKPAEAAPQKTPETPASGKTAKKVTSAAPRKTRLMPRGRKKPAAPTATPPAESKPVETTAPPAPEKKEDSGEKSKPKRKTPTRRRKTAKRKKITAKKDE